MSSKTDDETFFRGLVLDQLKRRGRIHLRGLLATMRRRLDEPATEPTQEVALLLRRKLRLFPPGIRDADAVRQILEGDDA